MSKLRYMKSDFVNSTFSMRLLVFVVFQFSILHSYLSQIKSFSSIVEYPVAPWSILFLGDTIFFLVTYGISVLYFFHDAPFMKKSELYAIMRLGKNKWLLFKIIRIWMQSIFLVITEIILSIVIMIPNLEWTADWGRVLYTIAMTDISSVMTIELIVNYKLMNALEPIEAMLIQSGMMVIVTGLLGMLLLTISLIIDRIQSIIIGGILVFLPIVFTNVSRYAAWISYISPFTWINISMFYQDYWYRQAITMEQAFSIGIVFSVILGVISMCAIGRKDFLWVEEE